MSEAKIKVGISIGPRVSELMNYGNYGDLQEITKTLVLEEFKLDFENFLCYHIAPNNKQLLQRRLPAHRMTEHTMTLKIHFLHSHLDLIATLEMLATTKVQGFTRALTPCSTATRMDGVR